MCEEKPLLMKVGFEIETRFRTAGKAIVPGALATAVAVPALDCMQQCMGQ